MNTSASALQIFLVSVIPDPHSLHFYCIALCCHGFTVRPRCQGTVGVVSRNLVCPKPYSVCMSARRPTFITPDRASSRMHSLASAKNWAQCVFPSKQYPNRYFFGTLFPTVSYNLLSRQRTFPTHMTLFPQSLDIFPQFQLIDFVLVYRQPHCPLTVLLTDAFAMNAVTDIFFCWRWFLLPLCTVSPSCNTRHRIPEYSLSLLGAECHRPFRDVLKSWCPFRHNVKNPHLSSDLHFAVILLVLSPRWPHPFTVLWPVAPQTRLPPTPLSDEIRDTWQGFKCRVTPDPNHTVRVFLLTLPYLEFP